MEVLFRTYIRRTINSDEENVAKKANVLKKITTMLGFSSSGMKTRQIQVLTLMRETVTLRIYSESGHSCLEASRIKYVTLQLIGPKLPTRTKAKIVIKSAENRARE